MKYPMRWDMELMFCKDEVVGKSVHVCPIFKTQFYNIK
jgi:hypothetical protein